MCSYDFTQKKQIGVKWRDVSCIQTAPEARAHPRVISNTPAKSEVSLTNSFHAMRETDRKTDMHAYILGLCWKKIDVTMYHNIFFHDICIVSWPMYRDTCRSSFKCFQFLCVQLKSRSAVKFHFSFWCYGSYISVFGNSPIPFKSIGKGMLN